MAVPNIFANATVSIPLSQLDANFATPVTLGNTAATLGNTVTLIDGIGVTTQTPGTNSTLAASTAYVDANFTSGTFVPTDASGAGLTLTGFTGLYSKAGKAVTVWVTGAFPDTANTSATLIGGLPYAAANVGAFSGQSFQGILQTGSGGGTLSTLPNWASIAKNASAIGLYGAGGTAVTNNQSSGSSLFICITYSV